MKLLFDQNLPRRLVAQVQDLFPGSAHVIAEDLDTATDRGIFEYARKNGFAVVSKDSDFRQLSFVYGSPPKVIWLRLGNCSVGELTDLLLSHVERILVFESEPESFLVIDPDGPQA